MCYLNNLFNGEIYMKTLNGQLFKKLYLNGYKALALDMARINELNVFPVPDGDTGTNMKMTMDGGVNAINNLDENHIGLLAKDLARGIVFSARGNSGVILSQFFKGFAVSIEHLSEVSVSEFAQAMTKGVEQAYKVVNNPTEGTILTVMREASTLLLEKNIAYLFLFTKKIEKC